MAEDTKAQETPEKETQESAMPAEEQQTTQEAQEAETQQPEQAQELSEDVKERTREQFEKLREQLRTERERRQSLEEAYQRMSPPQQRQPELPPVIDPNTGLFNEQAFNQMQQELLFTKQEINKLRSQTTREKIETEEKEAYSVHPELNPNNQKTWNKDFHNLTRAILADSMLYPNSYGGKQLSFKEAADQAKRMNPQLIKQAKEEGAKEAMESLTPKEQASLDAEGSPKRRTEAPQDLEQLKRRTRKGDIDAITQRLKNIPNA